MRISDTVAAVREGYPHRFTLLEFYERFVLLSLDVMKRHKGYDCRSSVVMTCLFCPFTEPSVVVIGAVVR